MSAGLRQEKKAGGCFPAWVSMRSWLAAGVLHCVAVIALVCAGECIR